MCGTFWFRLVWFSFSELKVGKIDKNCTKVKITNFKIYSSTSKKYGQVKLLLEGDIFQQVNWVNPSA